MHDTGDAMHIRVGGWNVTFEQKLWATWPARRAAIGLYRRASGYLAGVEAL
jgi:hypothetical protein